MKGINVIGDIHGRTNWKELIDLTCINIFVGDYFDPYDNILYPELESNFLDIIELKKQYPENIILLIGNHDAHYLPGYPNGESSRYNQTQASKITQLFIDNYEYFYGVVYYDSPTDSIISHAGISMVWYHIYFTTDTPSGRTVEQNINNLWNTNKEAFSFNANATPGDYYGTSKTHSPLWIRPYSLLDNNLFSTTTQIIGHTQVYEIIESKNIICVDILGKQTKSYKKFYV